MVAKEAAPQDSPEKPTKVPAASPKKSKIALIIVSILAFLFLIASAGLGYLYYGKTKENTELLRENSELASQKGRLENETAPSLQAQVDLLNNEVATLEGKIKRAQIYNNTFKYVNSLIEIHNGFSGWTTDEFNAGRSIALKTNDAQYLKVIDDAWNQQGIDPLLRVLSFLKATAAGIENSLK